MMETYDIRYDMRKYGCCEASPGVHINNQETIIHDSETWSPDDEARHMDFTAHPYWVFENLGVPAGYDSLDEAIQAVRLQRA